MPCKKPCPIDSICNEKTNRCNKLKSTRKSTTRKSTTRKSTTRKSPTRKSATRKSATRKSTTRKSTTRKSTTRKSTTRKSTTRKSTTRKSTTRKSTTRKSTTRKSPTRKSPTRKSTTRKSPTRKSPTRKSTTKKICKKLCPIDSVCNETTGSCNKIKPAQRKPSPAQRKPSPGLVETKYVYHPFYKRNILIDSEENCGVNRDSIQRYELPVKEQLGKICDMYPILDVEYILGPISYTEYRYKDINLCIFGERHNLEKIECDDSLRKKSITFTNFFQTLLLENKDKFYDFFFETSFINSENPSRNKIFGTVHSIIFYLLRGSFDDCLKLDKGNCPFKNLRAHYIDPRYYINREHINTIFSMYKTGRWPETDNFFGKTFALIINILTSSKLLLKEYSKSYLGQEIKDFCIARVQKKIDAFELTGTKPEDVKRYGFVLIIMTAEIMNAYTLCRIFRKFKPSLNQPTDIQNAIIYVGDAHAKAFNKFIKTVLGVKHTIKIKGPGCINTSQMKKKSVLFR